MKLPFHINSIPSENNTLKTDFAPAERADNEELKIQQQALNNNELLEKMTNSVSQMLVVLNYQRQIVYANKPFIDLLGLADSSPIIGKRPGEAVNCIHANQSESGCGTTEFCRTCGAVNAILESQKGIQSENECRILTVNNDALDLRIKATPYETTEGSMTIFAMNDISGEKRKQTLERVFFHDVLNSAGGISGLSSVIAEMKDQKDVERIANMINRASENLINEIMMQSQISAAERGDIALEFSEVSSMEILTDLADLYSQHEIVAGKFIVISKETKNVTLTTDAVLLRRIIGNMIKNALEASIPGSTVTLSCHKMENTVRLLVHNSNHIPRDVQLQLFKRSFTTKGTGHGIGTYSMKLLGEKYLKGKVGFESSPENGTTFYIDFSDKAI